ncbi:hypothetical protein RBSH_00551 [Rhodopirellula baltica SH28]|uniref:Uncharacterized protein n=1 Tax=Rhodopirellula baltica SH28 TaxID=993517 RepID=K5DMM1_RHOBT|nr:hypothetical protein RBSH_00551 [Rhodopirellula baltica SH28]
MDFSSVGRPNSSGQSIDHFSGRIKKQRTKLSWFAADSINDFDRKDK